MPYFDDNFGLVGERAARDEDGKTYYVPADMKYKEWKERFVDNDKFTNQVESGIIKYIKLPSEIDSIKGISKEISEGISNSIDNYTKLYNIKMNDIKVVSFGKNNENKPFRFQPVQKGNWYSANFEINKDYNFNGSLNEYQNRIMRNYNKGVLAAKSLEDLIGHEMAHFMTFAECKTWEEFKELEIKIAGNFIEGISLYADETRDGAESLAEAFIRMKNGENVPKEAEVLVNKYIERWKNK